MNLAEWLRVVAILLSPLIALQVSQVLQRRREKADRKSRIFRTLMATRASRLSPAHVEALNMIDLEFYGSRKKDRAVLQAWKAYLDHLAHKSASLDQWLDKGNDLFIDLIFAMAKAFEYEFDRTHIKSTSYFPEAHGQIEEDQQAIRRGVVALLEGKASLPVQVKPSGPSMTGPLSSESCVRS